MGRPYVKVPLRSNAILTIEKIYKYCFLWSILSSLHPCNKNLPNRVSNYRHYSNELNIIGFHFTNGFKCSDVHKFENLNDLSIYIFKLKFHQHQNKWKHKLLPIKVIKNESDRVCDLLIYKNQYVLNKKLRIFLGNHKCNYVCRHCLNSYTSQNVLNKHKQQCGEQDISSIRLGFENHSYWRKHFHKNPLYFGIYADFEADTEIDKSNIVNKTANR